MKRFHTTTANYWFVFFTIESESGFQLGDAPSDDQDNLLPSNEDGQGKSGSLDQIKDNLIQEVVDPARTRAVDPARTRVDPARTRK
jgi:hypothetical protein